MYVCLYIHVHVCVDVIKYMLSNVRIIVIQVLYMYYALHALVCLYTCVDVRDHSVVCVCGECQHYHIFRAKTTAGMFL